MNELTAAQKDLLDRVKTKEELRPFFFRKVKGLEWFDALYEERFFSADQNPRPQPAKEEGYVFIPTWPATEYLAVTSFELRDPKNEEYAEKFLKIIRDCTKYARSENYGNYRTWWKFSQIIRNIPPQLITSGDIELFDYWLNDAYDRSLVADELGEKWISELLKSNNDHCNELAIKLLEKLYFVEIKDIKSGSFERKEAFFRFDNYHAQKITSKVAIEAGRKLGLSAVQVFYQPFMLLLKELQDDKLSCIWRPAIEEHEQNRGHEDATDILIQAFRDSLIGFIETYPEKAKQCVGELLNSNFETVKRIAIYLTSQHYELLGSFSDQIIIDIYFKSNFKHEMWHFLRNNYNHLDTRLQNIVVDIVNNLKVVDEEQEEKIRKKASAYKQAEWLSSIKHFHPDIEALYEETIRIAGSEPDHPDFSCYMEVGWGDEKSPFNMEELRLLNNDDLIDKLNKFEDTGGFREPSLRGLTKCFKELVKSDPLRFYNHFDKFISSDVAFIYEIIEAYREMWGENKVNIPWNDVWGSLLIFCMQIVDKEQFWSVECSRQRSSFIANRHWVVGAIASLIEDGTRNDEHAFDERFLGDAKKLLLLLLERQEGEEFNIDSDAVHIAINSPRGKCIEALINLSLRFCRLADKSRNDHKEAWQKFEAIYDGELEISNRGVYEFSTLVANYLPNFLYMSNDWVKNNLGKIFNQQNYQQWLCALQGYAYISRIYQVIYTHLKHNGDFIKALDDQNVREKVKERIIQNIVFSYINDHENLNDPESLIFILLKRNIYDEIRQVIWFIWTLRKGDDKKIIEKVFELWPELLSLIDLNTEDGRNLASKLCNWSSFVEEIDGDNKNFLLTVAPFAERIYNSSELLKNLARISDKQPFEAYEIWIKMLEGGTPDFPKEAVEQLLNNLTTEGSEGMRKAKEVVDIYLKRGLEGPELYLAELIKKKQGS